MQTVSNLEKCFSQKVFRDEQNMGFQPRARVKKTAMEKKYTDSSAKKKDSGRSGQ